MQLKRISFHSPIGDHRPLPATRRPAAPGTPPTLPAALGRLRLRHLQVLDALERLGSLRRAALELGIAQPAAVVLVNDLEHAFGVPLVVRAHSGTTLTPAAHGVVARARVAIEEVAQAHDAALRAASGGGRLRLGASPYLISVLIPQLLVSLRAQLPGTIVDVREGTLDTLVEELAAGRLDALLGSADRALLAHAVDQQQRRGLANAGLDGFKADQFTVELVENFLDIGSLELGIEVDLVDDRRGLWLRLAHGSVPENSGKGTGRRGSPRRPFWPA